MNFHSKIPSDIIGLTTPSPVSRRGFFMTASAAAAAGYTLAESFYAASHFVGWEDVVIGDPLCSPYLGR